MVGPDRLAGGGAGVVDVDAVGGAVDAGGEQPRGARRARRAAGVVAGGLLALAGEEPVDAQRPLGPDGDHLGLAPVRGGPRVGVPELAQVAQVVALAEGRQPLGQPPQAPAAVVGQARHHALAAVLVAQDPLPQRAHRRQRRLGLPRDHRVRLLDDLVEALAVIAAQRLVAIEHGVAGQIDRGGRHVDRLAVEAHALGARRQPPELGELAPHQHGRLAHVAVNGARRQRRQPHEHARGEDADAAQGADSIEDAVVQHGSGSLSAP